MEKVLKALFDYQRFQGNKRDRKLKTPLIFQFPCPSFMMGWGLYFFLEFYSPP